jgi:hypothetical protein
LNAYKCCASPFRQFALSHKENGLELVEFEWKVASVSIFSPDRDLGRSPGTIAWTRLAQRILHAAAWADYAMKEECVAVIFRHGAEKMGSNCVREVARRGLSDFRVPECEEFCFSADAHAARTNKNRTRGEAGIEPTTSPTLMANHTTRPHSQRIR